MTRYGRPTRYKNRVQFLMTLEGELLEKFKKIAEKEDKPMNAIVQELMMEYNKIHGDGNPAFTLDQFNQEDFKICPALYSDNLKWHKYLKAGNLKEIYELRNKLRQLDDISFGIKMEKEKIQKARV